MNARNLMLGLALLGLGLLGACRIAGEGSDAPAPVGQSFMDQAHAECIRKGGDYISAKGGSFVCLLVPKDAGKSCRRADDCQSACLARSRTCAPVAPLLGCNDILTGSGIAVTQCID
jgi:hypothetical protein